MTLGNGVEDLLVRSEKEMTIDCEKRLVRLPGLIDAHVHFRTPGSEHKENWISGAKAAIRGGITTVFDMPNNQPPCVDPESFQQKKLLIDKQLKECGIPLNYKLFFGADKDRILSVGQISSEVIGIKIFMGSSTGGLVMEDLESIDRAFELAAQHNLMVAVHAEDEKILKERQKKFANEKNPAIHSKIRDRSAAIKATELAIALADKYNTRVYILHLSTKEELSLVRQARKQQILVFAETTPHHLFLNEEAYEKWGTKVQVNPPLRTKKDQEALWEAIHDETIDSIGSDHAPHTLDEKNLPFGKAPSGIPGIETTLPLLLNACNEGKISLEQVVKLMRINLEHIYNLCRSSDAVLVDMEMEKTVSDIDMLTKCGWSPYSGMTLKGWPVYTILNGNPFKAEDATPL